VELTGTVSEFDETGHFGVIDADDGRVLLFNLAATPPDLRRLFRIGTRVTFDSMSSRSGRAFASLPIGEGSEGASGPSRPPVERGTGRQ
jgi:cold shock CspA family protein